MGNPKHTVNDIKKNLTNKQNWNVNETNEKKQDNWPLQLNELRNTINLFIVNFHRAFNLPIFRSPIQTTPQHSHNMNQCE